MKHSYSPNGAEQVSAETTTTNTLPEWLRPKEACKRFGMSRAYLYRLLGDGSIRSTCIRKRGALKGIRLISRDSLAAFIEASVEGSAA